MRSRFIMIIFLMLVAVAAFAQTDQQKQTEDKELKKSYIYQWTDEKGVVHITDGLGKVPKKYRDKALKLESPRKDDSTQGQRQISQPAGLPEEEGIEEDRKAEWQQRMKDARQRLTDAQRRYRELERKRTELLGAWGGVASGHLEERKEAQQVEEQMKQVQKEVDDARNEVENVIPEEAHKAGVPPGWLRE